MAIACAALSGCALTKQISPNTYQSSKSAESRKLHEIFESFFEAELVLFPTFATEIGDHRYDDQLEITISEEHIAEQRRLFQRAPPSYRRNQISRCRFARPSLSRSFYAQFAARPRRFTV